MLSCSIATRRVDRSGSKSAAKQARYYFGMDPDPFPAEIQQRLFALLLARASAQAS